ncbi:four-carbon acid sugar kinase family protein [Microbacterium fluvii]|uniref:Four-carbon acid sugar kinase family protein n=1 Tax=Microbacterium fluvii TaxID=415215 RepID=A0ABW2HE53_9MICO|nr:four-carbon acid sugar kinase family protein [Microbacterium fluvii]MCU4673119.1 hypothetical protein [Microbacterium fluvii]
MKTIVLDDDPTGTQSATGATVLLEYDADAIADVLAASDSVYLQTNSRSLGREQAAALARSIRSEGETAARRLGVDVRFVLRGDSTLRGHVFAETEVFLDDAVMLFVPAFPDGGRTTVGGVHYVRIDGERIPADRTEYADDPVFPFDTAVLVEYVHRASGRHATSVPLAEVRAGDLSSVLELASPGTVVVPDAETDDDIRAIARAVDEAAARGVAVVVRSASPLAAELAGVASSGLMPTPLVAGPVPTLLVCGSHTVGATRQLAAVEQGGRAAEYLDTGAALADPVREGAAAAARVRTAVHESGFGIVATARERSSDHGTLDHGERVMTALTTAVREVLPEVEVVVSKGGITSADVARIGIGATRARVLGQVLPGVSVWRMADRTGRDVLYVVVPGNVGGPETLVDVLAALRLDAVAVAR